MLREMSVVREHTYYQSVQPSIIIYFFCRVEIIAVCSLVFEDQTRSLKYTTFFGSLRFNVFDVFYLSLLI